MTQTNTAGPAAGVDAIEPHGHPKSRKDLAVLMMGALGVVYGDIGTSPIYAFRQAMQIRPGAASTDSEILGLLSLIVWALTLTVAIKYVFFVTRADNNGEGGTLSLMALARKTFTNPPVWITVLGVLGAAMFFGDAIITPAISVLSAVEGVELVAPGLTRWVVPVTLVLIVGLFFVQRFGTAKVSIVFGPVTAVWFLTLGLSGLVHIIAYPGVLMAINPFLGAEFLFTHIGIALSSSARSSWLLPAPKRSMSISGISAASRSCWPGSAWSFPALLLNYSGRGLSCCPLASTMWKAPFSKMQPEWALIPFVAWRPWRRSSPVRQ